jgi:hypothetical protein
MCTDTLIPDAYRRTYGTFQYLLMLEKSGTSLFHLVNLYPEPLLLFNLQLGSEGLVGAGTQVLLQLHRESFLRSHKPRVCLTALSQTTFS